MSFGTWLRQALNDADISNAELARRAKLSPTYIGNLVRDFYPNAKDGEGRPSADAAIRIAGALPVNIDEALEAAGYAATKQNDFIKELGVLWIGWEDWDEEQQTRAKEWARNFATLVRAEEAEKNNKD